MNTTEILAKIKTLLGVETDEVQLATMKLEDKITIVESENFEAGDEIVIVTEDGKVALPEGDYTLEDGRLLVVKEEGIIDHLKDGKEKEEEKEEVVEKEEVEEKEMEEKVEYSETSNNPKKIIETVSKELHFEEIEKLKKEIEELKLKATTPEVEKTEEPVAEKVEEEKAEEIELSIEENPKPITHNPENKKEVEGMTYGQGGTKTTLDRVMQKLSK